MMRVGHLNLLHGSKASASMGVWLKGRIVCLRVCSCWQDTFWSDCRAPARGLTSYTTFVISYWRRAASVSQAARKSNSP